MTDISETGLESTTSKVLQIFIDIAGDADFDERDKLEAEAHLARWVEWFEWIQYDPDDQDNPDDQARRLEWCNWLDHSDPEDQVLLLEWYEWMQHNNPGLPRAGAAIGALMAVTRSIKEVSQNRSALRRV